MKITYGGTVATCTARVTDTPSISPYVTTFSATTRNRYNYNTNAFSTGFILKMENFVKSPVKTKPTSLMLKVYRQEVTTKGVYRLTQVTTTVAGPCPTLRELPAVDDEYMPYSPPPIN